MDTAPVANAISCTKFTKKDYLVSTKYIQHWKPKDSLRETLQNQYDAINSR